MELFIPWLTNVATEMDLDKPVSYREHMHPPGAQTLSHPLAVVTAEEILRTHWEVTIQLRSRGPHCSVLSPGIR